MRMIILAGILLLSVVQVWGETYSWVDESGTYNFTEDFSSVPKKYRSSVIKRGDMSGEPSDSAHQAEPAVKVKSAPVRKNGAAPETRGQADSGLYGGKKPEAWLQEMRPLYSELKRLEQELDQLDARIKSPRGVSREDFSALSQQFKATQKQYNDALKSYNDMNDAANKVGLPAEFRK